MKIKILVIMVLFTLSFVSFKNDKADPKNKSKIEVSTKSASEQHGQAGVKVGEGEKANALMVAKSLPDFTTLVDRIEATGV